LAQRQAHWLELRNYLMARLRELPGVVIFAEQAEHLPNTVLISVPQFQGETLLAGLDQAGFMLSSGSACTSGNLAPSHVLVAMGVEPHLLRNVLRISLGKDTTRAELDQFLAALHRLMAQCSPWQPKTRAGNIPI
ncbi:MAG TPA: aminotransferase class V-fold PLP-dependent enzyme, partial [Gammaproteobacteria bacterium]|nr:aminotransferase class V-fold PLP-dependent enzyme [Gammaproteobacteria bacterium]